MQVFADAIARQNAAVSDKAMIQSAAFSLIVMDDIKSDTSLSTNASFLSMINGITGQTTKHLEDAKDASRRAWS